MKYGTINPANYLGLGKTSTTNNSPSPASLSASEIWNIDSKMDDGLPAMGKIWVSPQNSPCVDSDGNYMLTSSTQGCTIFFFFQ